ncbi:AI-2E family transporter [Bacillus sp. DX1.1]|uniref:AI-2E family transporter n=1 Tax=unclassified Bacillus (in: firmicutes) TaxID=185979 RepID=UPI002570B38C|nr:MULTISPECIES: AI-2E family transporter [unclassified Bacillus (in: firmicutes)]MDM5156583.1 AI-2E family transporter [Bacillus sp. DX1.1]WJE80845.1 AI-2E family transporter [Bacillus sp. DX3.1]
MKNLKIIWIYRLGLLLLLFLCLFVFLKIKPLWGPILFVFKVAITPFFIACFIAYLLHPLIEKLHKKGMPRTIAILLIYLLFFGGIGYGIYKGTPIVIAQLQEINEQFPQFMKMYDSWLDGVSEQTENFPAFIHEKVKQIFVGIEMKIQALLNKVMSTARGVLDSLLLIFLIPFIVFYILKDYEEFYHIFWKLVPSKWRSDGQLLAKEIDKSLGNYIRGQLFVCLVLGGMSALSFWFIGMKYPLLLGIIIGVTDIIPYFGPILGAIPTLMIAATVSTNLLIKAGIALAILQFVESNILSPYIVGKSLRMHPVVIMLALLVGGEIGGIVGLLLSVPILAVVRTIVVHIKPLWKH